MTDEITSGGDNGSEDSGNEESDFRDILNSTEGDESSEDEGTTESEDEEEEVERGEGDEEEGEVDEEEDEEEDVEDKEKEDKDDTPPDTTTAAKVSVRELNKQYPKLLKEHPELRTAIFRDREFSQLFHSPESARQARVNAENFDALAKDISEGKVDNFFKAIGDSREEFVKALVPSLLKEDKELFRNTFTEPILRSALTSAKRDAESAGNKNLSLAVDWLAKYLYGTEDGTIPEAKGKQKPAIDPEKQRLLEHNRQTHEQQLNYLQEEIDSELSDKIVTQVSKGLDPGNVLSKLEKEAITDKIVRELISTLQQDQGHMIRMKQIWQNPNLSQEFKSRVVSATLAGASKYLNAIKAKHRAAVLKDKKIPMQHDPRKTLKRIPQSTGPSRGNNGRVTSRNVDYGRSSDLDILNDRAVLKR